MKVCWACSLYVYFVLTCWLFAWHVAGVVCGGCMVLWCAVVNPLQ
jgi:hypothetical protein